MNYVISDPHGRYDLYKKMLERIGFSDGDTLYILGDFVDRSKGGLKILLDVSDRDNVIGIIGNHDYIASNVLSSLSRQLRPGQLEDMYELIMAWKMDGGMDTLDEYRALSAEDRKLSLMMLDSLRNYAEVSVGGREFVLCHAGIANYVEGKPLYEYNTTDFIVEREDYSKPKFSKKGKYLVTGHTPTVAIEGAVSGKIYRNHDHIAIDCGAVFDYGLGCLCLDTMEEFYVK